MNNLFCETSAKAILALVFIVNLLDGSAVAGTVSSICFESPRKGQFHCNAFLSGTIEKGDDARLRKFLSEWKNSPQAFLGDNLILDSPGGNVSEAMKIAETVRGTLSTTTVSSFVGSTAAGTSGVRKFTCASACFLIWAAGAERFSNAPSVGTTRLGLHRPYLSANAFSQSDSAKMAKEQQGAMLATREFLLAESIPVRLIEEMMRRSSRDVYWLTAEDSAEISLTAPWFEEWKIARCNFNPAVERAMLIGGINADPKVLSESFAQDDCVSENRQDARRAYIKSLRREDSRGKN